jgi:PAS domain S-box-containing protein
VTPEPSPAAERIALFGDWLRDTPPEALLERASAGLARGAGCVAVTFALRADGEVTQESWFPAHEELRDSLRDVILQGLAETPAGTSAYRTPEETGGGYHLWFRPLTEGDQRFAGLALAAPASGRLCDPAERQSLDLVASLMEERLGLHREVQRLRRDRDQRARYYKNLDSQLRILDRERQKFVAVVNQSDTFTMVSDENFQVRWLNASTADRLTAKEAPQRWIDRPLQDIWDRMGLLDAVVGAPDCPVAMAFARNDVVHREFLVHRDGSVQAFYLTALPVIGADGRPDEVLILIQDLSNLDTLRRSEARYRLLFERSPDAMLMVEPETWRIVVANPEAARLLGFESTASLEGVPVQRIHEGDDWESARSDYERTFGSDDVSTGEHVLAAQDGSLISVNMMSARFDLDGAPVALVEFQDVTEKRRLEMELRHAQKMEAIGRLAGGIAHDFNNLLAVIQGQSEILITRLPAEDPLGRTAESVRKAAVRGSLLTRQLLAFSRKDVQKSEVMDLRELVLGIQAMLATLLGADVELHLETYTRSCRVEADRAQLEQVVMNLVANARDALTTSGNVWIRVGRRDALGADGVEGRHVLLQVADDGAGMDEATRARVFEPFFTTKEQGRGTGLGLSSSYGIVQEYGGTIDLESVPGQGTTFSIRLPRVHARSTSGAAGLPALRTSLTQGSERILVVEDENDVREMAVEVLENLGYDVVEAASGADALELLGREEKAPELLLTDVIMPGMSGGELVRRAMELRPGLKVLFMSGYTAEDAMVKQGLADSVADYLQKPFSLDALSRKVRTVLDGAASGSGVR